MNECCSADAKKVQKTTENIQTTKLRWIILTLVIVVPLEILSFYSIHLPPYVEIPFFLILIFLFGKDVFTSGFRSLIKLNFSDINLLMTIAIFGAMYLGEYIEAVIIVVLFSLGNALEDMGITRSQSALQELVEKSPKSALLKGNEEKVPIEQIQINDTVVIKPGDYIPLDGKIIKGNSIIDEAAITGEPLPKNKYENDNVYAGSINGQGYLEIQVLKTTKDTTLAKIIELTFQSTEQKSKSQKFIESFAQYYTPTIMIIAILLVVIPVGLFQQPFETWFTTALTLLLISCPCALVISTPVTIFSAVGNATKKGILIKGGRFLEEMGKIKAIAFDKTRTLTKGEPVVSDVVPFNGTNKQELLACVAGMETLSEHPLAKSIVNIAKDQKLDIHPFVNFQAVMGNGITGECTVCVDKHHCLGTLKFITQEHEVGQEIVNLVEKFQQQGKTTVVVSDNKKVSGVISITDEIRPESLSTIKRLKDAGITPVMLTGDNTTAATYVAKQLDISEIKAELLPQGKVDEMKSLLRHYGNVAMIGDGVNDAPALATASVGIAMGAIGSDIAVENADIALMNNNLHLIPYLIRLGKTSVQTIQFNTSLAVLVKVIFILLALLGRSNLTLAIFADVGVTMIVVLNSLRLFNFRYETR